MDLAHLHLVLNHVPVTAAVFGFVVLGLGILFRSAHVRNVGLGLLVVSALTAIPVYLTGESAEEVVEGIQGASESFIDKHQSAAEVSLGLAMVSGAIALAAMIPLRMAYARFRGFLVTGALLASVLTCASMAWTANLGGQIRHTEIRPAGQAVNQTQTEQKAGTKTRDADDDDR